VPLGGLEFSLAIELWNKILVPPAVHIKIAGDVHPAGIADRLDSDRPIEIQQKSGRSKANKPR
jgi:hypothetical protein